MGPRSHHNHTPSCSPPPDYRIAALRVKDACGAGYAGRDPARSLTRTGPLTRIGSSRETGNAQAPGGRPRASPACLQPSGNPDKNRKPSA